MTTLLFLLECVKLFFMVAVGELLVVSVVIILLTILEKLFRYEMDLPLRRR